MSRSDVFAIVICILLSASVAASGLAQTHAEQQEFPAGGRVLIHVRAGDLRIMKGTDPHHIVLRYSAERHHQDITGLVQHRFEVYGDEAEIQLKAPANNVDFNVEIEVPGPADLKVRMLAGDLTVEGIEGNKDIELHFGDLAIKGVRQASYRVIDASTHAGDVSGLPGGTHGWIGQSGKVLGNGQYRLHAHVGAGDVRLDLE
jgi:hypothetical protein